MVDVLKSDKELIDSKRKELSIPDPMKFDKFRITPEYITKLFILLQIPFTEEAIIRRIEDDSVIEEVPVYLQLMRLYQVFGMEHIKFEHTVIEHEIVQKGNDNMHFYKLYVKLSIGNWTIYNENNSKPCSTFVSYYDVKGIGYEGDFLKGIAEKKAVINGKKECLKNMGILAYLYVENEYRSMESLEKSDKACQKTKINFNDKVCQKTKIILKEKPVIHNSSEVFLKCKAVDVQNKNSEIEILVYKENSQMKEEHQKMINNLKRYKNSLIPGKKLIIEYIKDNAIEKQYIIRKIFNK